LIKSLEKFSHNFHELYVTVDMDVLDPAYAPAVGNPEPEGIDPTLLLDVLEHVPYRKVSGFDIVELAPNYDFGVTSVQAAKIIFEVMCFMEKKKNSSKKHHKP